MEFNQAERQDVNFVAEEAEKEADKLKQLLCSLCEEIDPENLQENKAVWAWWKENKKIDNHFADLSIVNQHIVDMIAEILEYAFTYHPDDNMSFREIAMEILEDVRSDITDINTVAKREREMKEGKK